MRKIYLIIILTVILFSPIFVQAKELKVTFNSCIDGDTAKFNDGTEIMKVRFLAIDTPETKSTKTSVEPYGKEASDYTCAKITNAKTIILEFDDNSDLKDKYDRYLAWVFVDENLLQKDLVTKGYAEVAYLYGDYKYTPELELAEDYAKTHKVGIWGEYQEEVDYYQYLIVLVIISLLFMFIFSKKQRKRIINQIVKIIEKTLKKKV